MAKENIARKILYPTDKKILVRVAFLYVGQGGSELCSFETQTSIALCSWT